MSFNNWTSTRRWWSRWSPSGCDMTSEKSTGSFSNATVVIFGNYITHSELYSQLRRLYARLLTHGTESNIYRIVMWKKRNRRIRYHPVATRFTLSQSRVSRSRGKILYYIIRSVTNHLLQRHLYWAITRLVTLGKLLLTSTNSRPYLNIQN